MAVDLPLTLGDFGAKNPTAARGQVSRPENVIWVMDWISKTIHIPFIKNFGPILFREQPEKAAGGHYPRRGICAIWRQI
jgi:hypothetical protein